jgi:hypothetical protein
MIVRFASLTCGVLLAVVSVGCGGSSSSTMGGPQASHLRSIGRAYQLFLKEYRRLPANEYEFKVFVAQVAAEDLKAKNLTVEQLSTSERDGKPYVVFYRGNPPPEGSFVAAYEQVGVGGRRFVADTAGNVKEVDEGSFRELVPNGP